MTPRNPWKSWLSPTWPPSTNTKLRKRYTQRFSHSNSHISITEIKDITCPQAQQFLQFFSLQTKQSTKRSSHKIPISARRPGTSTFGWVYLWGLGGFCFWWEEKVDVFFCVKEQVDVYIYIYIYIYGIPMIMINIPNRFVFLIWYIISWHVIFYT